MRISDWSSDVCSSDLLEPAGFGRVVIRPAIEHRRPRHRGAVRVHQKTLTTLTSEIPENIEERRHLEEVAERALHRVEPDHDHIAPQDLGIGRPPLADRLHVEHRRSEEHTSELQSLMRISYAVFCLKNKKKNLNTRQHAKQIIKPL